MQPSLALNLYQIFASVSEVWDDMHVPPCLAEYKDFSIIDFST